MSVDDQCLEKQQLEQPLLSIPSKGPQEWATPCNTPQRESDLPEGNIVGQVGRAVACCPSGSGQAESFAAESDLVPDAVASVRALGE